MLGALILAGMVGGAPNPYASIAATLAAYAAGAYTAEQVVAADLARIEAIDRAGPRLQSVLAVNPDAAEQARDRDAERSRGRAGPLQGVVVLLKDNIETADRMATTAGSLALSANVTGRDAPVAARLRASGAVILGKANLSEWANFRSSHSVSGWSALGGLTRNPYVLDRSACGSSTGSAVAVAAGLATAAIGTETDGSITCPAGETGLVGFKPTVGLVSRSRIVPISPPQDTAGPIARSVADAAAVLTVIAGSDPADPATRRADVKKVDYLKALDAGALKGVRIGVLRGQVRDASRIDPVFEKALETLKRAGGVLVPVTPPSQADHDAMRRAEFAALKAEFKASLNAYLGYAAPAVAVRKLDQLIAFNAATPAETPLFGQEIFEEAAKAPPLTDPAYRKARALARRLARQQGLDRMFAQTRVAAIVAETGAPAPVVDLVNGTAFFGSPSSLPAVAGYPHLTVPMGQVDGLPVGLSIIGPAWSDARVLAFGFAFEQARGPLPRPGFLASVGEGAALQDALRPVR